MIEPLTDALPKEITRCEKVLAEYLKLGSVGEFARMHIEKSIREAKAAIHTWDAALMYDAYLELRKIE